MRVIKLKKTVVPALASFLIFGFAFFEAEANILDTLKEKIQSRTAEVEKLKLEINQYQKELDTTNVKARSLTQDIQALNTTKKKLDGDITTAEKNIDLTNATISELEDQIQEHEERITRNRQVIIKMIQNLQHESNNSLAETFLSNKSLSSVGEYLDHTEKFEEKIQTAIRELYQLKEELADRIGLAENKRKTLTEFKKELSGKKQAVVETQKQKDKLLVSTKSEQANYQKILTEKIRLKEQFEREIFAYESELKLSIDKSKLPTAVGGVLQWPVDSVRITQYFGATVDAKRLYVSGSHNGIDLGATDGTKIKAALSGTVWATGNTDLKAGCYSYGKWVLLKHANGLSTVYAHLSVISVNTGDAVTTGDIIGFSGRTGYVTGPHLHFSVLATEGTQPMVIPAEKTVNCRGVMMPIADSKAYLDPILYLPKL